jgi:hypothetical protein
MKDSFNKLKKDKLIFRLYIISFLFLIFTVVYTLIYFTKLPPLLPIFNQYPWGKDRLAPTIGIFLPILIVFFYFIMNIFLSAFSYQKYPLIGRIFAITTMLISLLILLFVTRTITLIT